MSHNLAHDTEFRQTRFRSGYAADEVELFIEAVEDALRSPFPRLHSNEVAEQQFTPVMLRPGFRMDDVDDYLTEAEHRLREREIAGW